MNIRILEKIVKIIKTMNFSMVKTCFTTEIYSLALLPRANFIYFKLGCVPIQPTKGIVIETMPECFKDTYPNTRVIIDSTELFCQKPSSLTIQSSLFFHYKDHITYKGPLGISPYGAITFISELYDGSTSDVEMVKRYAILNKELWSKDDDDMAERGFTIKKTVGASRCYSQHPFLLRRERSAFS